MVTFSHIKDLLDMGLYTPQEAATYARIPARTLTRWLYGNRSGEHVIHPRIPPSQEKVVTFLDLIQTVAIREIRSQLRVPLPKIREAIDRASEKYGLYYPFARQHRTFYFGKDIFIVPPGQDADIVQLTGRHRDQMGIRPVLEIYMKDLTFDPKEGLATEYCAFQWQDQKITMNPQYRFGEPIVVSCNYTAQALWEACISEGSPEAAAEAYGVTSFEAEVAYRYYLFLQGKDSA